MHSSSQTSYRYKILPITIVPDAVHLSLGILFRSSPVLSTEVYLDSGQVSFRSTKMSFEGEKSHLTPKL